MGGKLGLRMPGAVSFCNVLFVGNVCAGLVTLALSGPRRTLREYGGLSRRTKWNLILGALEPDGIPSVTGSAAAVRRKSIR